MSADAAAVAMPASVDPALPHLGLALDPLWVGGLFQRQWPGTRPAPEIVECAREHIRWSPGAECVVTYRMRTSIPGGATALTLGAVSATVEGATHWLYSDDGELRGLAAAADPSRMAAWFGERLGTTVDSCRVTPLRYRPGVRCVLRYELGGGQAHCFGKVLSGSRSAGVATVVTALGERVVAPLVGHAPEWQLVVQRDAGLESVARLDLDAADTLDVVHSAGRLLARMHAHTALDADVRTLADDARDLAGYGPLVSRVDSRAADGFVRGVELLAARRDARTPVASHGAFRLNQVHVSNAGPRLIDLDTYCRAAPERDAGNVLAYLRWRQIRGAASAEAVERARDAILSGYALDAGRSLETAWLRAFEAASLLRIAGRRCRSLDDRRWPFLPALIDQALGELRGAEARE